MEHRISNRGMSSMFLFIWLCHQLCHQFFSNVITSSAMTSLLQIKHHFCSYIITSEAKSSLLNRLQTNRGYKKTNRNTDFLLLIFVSYSRIRLFKKGIRILMKGICFLRIRIPFIRIRIPILNIRIRL